MEGGKIGGEEVRNLQGRETEENEEEEKGRRERDAKEVKGAGEKRPDEVKR